MIAKPSRAAPSHGTPLHGRNNDDDDELVQPGSNFTFFSRSRFRQSISVGTRIDTPSGPQLLVSFRSVPFRFELVMIQLSNRQVGRQTQNTLIITAAAS